MPCDEIVFFSVTEREKCIVIDRTMLPQMLVQALEVTRVFNTCERR
jgi:hypothetical protein